MHTAVLGPTNTAVHDRGVLGEAPALFVAAASCSAAGETKKPTWRRTMRCPPPIRSASIAETAADHPHRRTDPISNPSARLLQRMSPVVDLLGG